MQKITVTREFRHMDLWDHQARTYPPANYTVVDRPSEVWECSPRCAEVAVAEGWAVWSGGTVEGPGNAEPSKQPEAEKVEARPTGSRTGGVKPSASSRPARRSTKAKPKK